jgi:hypothetical protein
MIKLIAVLLAAGAMLTSSAEPRDFNKCPAPVADSYCQTYTQWQDIFMRGSNNG